MSYSPSPPPPLSRATLVIGLYGAMGIAAFLLAAGRGDPDLYRLGGSPAGWQLASAPAFGIALGLGLAFGLLAKWTGNLGGPIAAHFVINFLNLRYIVAEPVPAHS